MMRINRENIKNNRAVRRAYYIANGIVNRGALKRRAEKTIGKFGVQFQSQEEREKIIADMLHMNMLYGYGFDEYLYFHFSEKSLQERRSFVADWEHLGYTCAMNNPDNAEIFDNKWKTYLTYKDYYRREVLLITGENSKKEFYDFLNRHTKAIVKPIDDSCGHGVKICEKDTTDDGSFETILAENNNIFLVEELINQAEEMAIFHPASVNTIRATTIRLDNAVVIVHPFMRMGQHGSIVDNGGSGGIMCTIDSSTGTIIAAADENGRSYMTHPDSKLTIIGYKIPQWDKLVLLAKQLAQVVPDNRYTGWDLALTDESWVLVEANRRGQFVGWQIPTQIGFRNEINKLLSEMGKNY